MQNSGNGSMTAALAESTNVARRNAEAVAREYIGTEHLLIALLDGESTTAKEVLRRLAVEVEALRTAAEDLGPPAAAPWGTTRRRSGVHPPAVEAPFTTKAQAAWREAIATRDEFGGVVSTGQLLKALLNPQFISGGLMKEAGIEIEDVDRILQEMLETNAESFRSDVWA